MVIRADASAEVGSGHVMRCLALAQAWQETGGEATFITAGPVRALETRLRADRFDVEHLKAAPGNDEDARPVIETARKLGASWVVVDGYVFGAAYQKSIKDAELCLLFVDDNGHASHYYADLVLNQNIHASESLYQNREPHTQLLLGPKYALLRQEFRQWRGWRPDVPDIARKLLVTMGAADKDNAALKIIQAMNHVRVEGAEAVVLIGGNNPYLHALQSASQRIAFPVELKQDVVDMPEMMAWADVAVIACGSTCWELAFMGVPAITVVTADIQLGVARALHEAGILDTMGWWHTMSAEGLATELTTLMLDRDLREKKIRMGQEMVDGRGAENVVNLLRRRSTTKDACLQGEG